MGTTIAISPAVSVAPVTTDYPSGGDFLVDVEMMARRIDRRLRMSLTPEQYALVNDLVLATRISTIARDAVDELAESPAA